MDPRVASRLIARGVIRQGTEFQAYFATSGLAGRNEARVLGTFALRMAVARPQGDTQPEPAVLFEGVHLGSGVVRTFHTSEVVAVDGMAIPRLVRTYGLTETGQELPQGRRRGRRRKADILADAAALAEAAPAAADAPRPA